MKVELNESRAMIVEASGKRGITKALKAIQKAGIPIECDGYTITVSKSIVSNCKTIK